MIMELFVLLVNKAIGKTYSAVRYIINCKLQDDYIIITNVKSFKAFEDIIYIEDMYELMSYVIDLVDVQKTKKPVIIFFDEIFSLINKNYSVEEEITTFISQLRKRHLVFITTAQEWSEINITFRKYVRFQVSCRMYSLPILHNAFLLNHINDGENLKLNPQTMEYEAPTVKTIFMKGNRSIIEAYDTYETITVTRKSHKKNKYADYVRRYA